MILSIDMCFVLVYCCVGMLVRSCLLGATPILGRKCITLPHPNKISNCTNEKRSLTGGNFKVSGYFREEDVVMELIHD